MSEMALSDFLNPTPIVDAGHPAVAGLYIPSNCGRERRSSAGYCLVLRDFAAHYPRLAQLTQGNFELEVEREIAESAR